MVIAKPVYKNLVIYYFSGTGNARRVVHWIAGEAVAQSVSIRLVDITKSKKEPPVCDKDTLIGFCAPTHGFNIAPLMLSFILRFPPNSHTSNKVFILNTRAGMKLGKAFLPGLSGLALLLPALILRLKAYQIQGLLPLDMPSNWISLHPGLRSSVVASIVQRCQRITLAYSRKLFMGKAVNRGYYDMLQDLLISPISVAYYFYGRFMLAKTYMATNACNHCGLCERNCPVGAIKQRHGRPFWTHTCENCMRCMNNCPQRAIETPHGLVILTFWMAFSLLPLLITKLLLSQQWIPLPDAFYQSRLFANLLLMGLGFLVVYPSYRLTHYLMRFPFFSTLVTYSSLTKYKWWRRYPGPGEELPQ